MKNVFITGANEGIGYYMVCQFLEEGKNVSVLDINTDRLESLREQHPGRLLAIKGDVSDLKSVNESVQMALNEFGKIDYAIHNACHCPFADFEKMSYEEYYSTFAVNYYGAVNLCRAVLPAMKERKSGSVFFTSSSVGITGFPGINSYASSKGAIEAFAKCMALEYEGSGISFHIMHPPLTKTKSAKALRIPEEFKVSPEVVGRGLAKRIDKNKYIICHNNLLAFEIKLMSLFPVAVGRFLSDKTKKCINNL